MTFDYLYTGISDIAVEMTACPKTGKTTPTGIIIDGEKFDPTDRFWVSVASRYGISRSMFKYFDPNEVFERISQREANDRLRVCIERNDNGSTRLLAASVPTKPCVTHDEMVAMLTQYNGSNIRYNNGVIESTHEPRIPVSFNVEGMTFDNRFMISTPIDGYGMPNIYLGLSVGSAGTMVSAFSKNFKSTIALGNGADDVTPAIVRALDGFNNDEGYAAVRQRIESAAMSWASIYESSALYKHMIRVHTHKQASGTTFDHQHHMYDWWKKAPRNKLIEQDESFGGSPLLVAYHSMAGDSNHLYGLANLDALSSKKQRGLPVRCSVLDLIIYCSEAATHYVNTTGARILNEYVGGLIASEYDLEGTMSIYENFDSFMLDRAAPVVA